VSTEFPTTHATWIAAQLARGAEGRAEVSDHIMRRYAGPLRAYIGASSLRAVDDADALVNGFFVTRLAREDYVAKWRESALPLRRWLVNGLLLHARERIREQRKSAGAAPSCDGCGCGTPCEVGLEPSAFERFERAWSRALLGDACSLAQRELVAEGDGDAWEVFRRHFLDESSTPTSARSCASAPPRPAHARAARATASSARCANSSRTKASPATTSTRRSRG